MKTFGHEITYLTHSRHNIPVGTVTPGEVFRVYTQLNSGTWLKNIDDLYAREKQDVSNPCVCLAVEGAEPGDSLAVKILNIEPDEVGYTGFDGTGRSGLFSLIDAAPWGLTTKTVRIAEGLIHWSDTLQIPIAPMIGVIGTAPANEELVNTKAGAYGGNMDVQEVTTGACIYLPVAVPGALLHIGDVHAIQGDGELCSAGGTECRAHVTLQIEIVKDTPRWGSVRLENDEYIVTICSGRSVEETFYGATADLLTWLKSDYGFSREEGYMLMAQLMEARASQYVNPTRTYLCKMPKKYLGAK
ncbi:MAG: acetamidase/formamidase family protein [Symbiobacteriaceae bacterium]|nr:acetamidase/formamidase family protein [Symbiobacteriaceae bacterium]